MGMLEEIFGADTISPQQRLQRLEAEHRRAMQNIMSPLRSGLEQGLLGGGYSPQFGQQMARVRPSEIAKSVVEKTLSFIQTLRNEIDEWF